MRLSKGCVVPGARYDSVMFCLFFWASIEAAGVSPNGWRLRVYSLYGGAMLQSYSVVGESGKDWWFGYFHVEIYKIVV
jgi:hypothetical protein